MWLYTGLSNYAAEEEGAVVKNRWCGGIIIKAIRNDLISRSLLLIRPQELELWRVEEQGISPMRLRVGRWFVYPRFESKEQLFFIHNEPAVVVVLLQLALKGGQFVGLFAVCET